jgi:hypothetical protein
MNVRYIKDTKDRTEKVSVFSPQSKKVTAQYGGKR